MTKNTNVINGNLEEIGDDTDEILEDTQAIDERTKKTDKKTTILIWLWWIDKAWQVILLILGIIIGRTFF